MKNPSSPSSLLTALALAALALSGCARSSPPQDDASAPANRAPLDYTEVTWSEIKDFGYEHRIGFTAGLDRMAKAKEADFESLKMKLRGLPAANDVSRKAAEQRFQSVRMDLRLHSARLRVTPEEEWEDQKKICVQSWHSLQAAYANVLRGMPE